MSDDFWLNRTQDFKVLALIQPATILISAFDPDGSDVFLAPLG
jgi:hypothetical protein